MSDLFDFVVEEGAGDFIPAAKPRREMTQQQFRAVKTRGDSVVVSAGAGCGKTEVLTQRYLSHLRDDGVEVSQLVAITFTDRAAREMRKRIRAAIKNELSAEKNSAKREGWERHLRNLETAAISTIHAFCGTLLRQHAVAAGLDPRFEILEDVLSSNVRDEALRAALQELLTAKTPTGDDLRELAPLYGWPATASAIESLLAAADPTAWERWGRRNPDDIADEWLTRRRDEILRQYVQHLITAVPGIAHCLHLLRTTPCKGPLMRANVQKLLDDTPKLADAPDLAAAIEELCEAAKVGKERGAAWPDEATYEAIKKAFAAFRKDLPGKLSPFTEEVERPAEAVVVGQRFIRVAAACSRVYQSRKRRAGVLDFHDLLVMARDLLRDRPKLRAQVQQRLRFVLIDELQDTDPVQMELIDMLCGSETRRGALFAVGDAKQSIYRFRGAEVELFQKLRQTIPEAARQELSVNFRSQPQILHFVNALFRRHIPDYEPLTAQRTQVNSGPCVEFLWSSRTDEESVQAGRRRDADRIAGRIASMIARDERLVVDSVSKTLRPARARDVVLLFRSMSNVATYEATLRRHGLDYYLVGGRAFFAQQEVYDLISLLRALENPQDAVSLAGTLRSPFGCLRDDTLYLLNRHCDGIWAGLHDDATIAKLPADERIVARRTRGFLDRWRTHKDRLPIAGLINLVLGDCGYDAALQREFLGDRKLANLWKLIDLARDFDRSGMFGLADFIKRMGELVRSQPREEQAATLPEGANVVRLMSIHQAKGLEFPVVVLPDLAAKAGGPHLPSAHWDMHLGCVARPPTEDGAKLFSDFGWRIWQMGEDLADWQEELRTRYVACTRAEDYLILSAAMSEPFKPANPMMTVLSERFDLESGECRDDSIPDGPKPIIRVVGSDEVIPDSGLRAERSVPPPLGPADIAGVYPIPVRPPNTAIFELADLDLTSPRTRAIRAVIRTWDFADPDGWQTPLADAVAAESDFNDPSSVREELAAGLSAFAKSKEREQLAAATEVIRDAEYFLPWPIEGDDGPMFQGRIDLLWRDATGWHILAWDSRPLAGGDSWRGRKPALLAAAWAVRQQLGKLPRTIGLYSFSRRALVSLEPTEAAARSGISRLLADLRKEPEQ